MAKNFQYVLSFFKIQNVEDLLGRKIKLSFYHAGAEVRYSVYFTISQFTCDYGQFSFPSMEYSQGLEVVQFTLFSEGAFHILVTKKGKPLEGGQVGYFYSTKKFPSRNLFRGKIELLP